MNRRPNPRSLAAAQAKAAEIMAGRRGFAPGMTMHGNAVIVGLEQQRADQFAFIDKLTGDVEAASRDMSDTERENVKAAHDRVKAIDEQLKPLREFEELRGADQQSAGRYTPTGGDRGADQGDQGDRGRMGARTEEREHKYRSVGEFLADTYRASSRAQRAGQQLESGVRDAAADRLRSHGLTVEGGSLVRAAAPHNTTAEVPGLIPQTIVGEVMSDVDAARPFITSVGPRDLGGIPGLTFERPTITQHVQVAKQSAEKATVANRQFEVDGIPFSKDTYGGWANVSRQSIDWTSPAVWDALMTDFVEQYGLETENAAADAFATAVVQETELGTAETIGEASLQELLTALYGAAVQAYQGSGRLPDTIWASLDWWAVMGPLMDYLKATTAGDGGGDSNPSSFAGNLLRVPRIIVPSFAAGTLIVGVKSRTEVYEDRFGFLSVVEPKVFGVELAYGGYMASGTVKPGAFAKVVPNPGV
ncbi:MAG: hypothetical protein CMF72_24755 [Mameliella sp.]|nr:hypothetical protein [Mameliella sp.]